MSELYTKSMKKLELDAVLRQLSEQAVSQEAKARCLAYQPLRDAAEIRILQQQTSAACHLVEF